MSEALSQLRKRGPTGRSRDGECVCGEPLEVVLVTEIRERGKHPKMLYSRSQRFCASCAVTRVEDVYRV